MKTLHEIGTTVYHFGGGSGTHGKGTIIGYNTNKPIAGMSVNFNEKVEAAAKAGLLGALVSSFYSFENCPYIVKFDSGYTDVYEETSLTLEESNA